MNADASISERGASRVPWPWVLPIGIYLVGLAGLALYAIVALWPDAGAPGTEAPGPTFLVWPFPRGSEQATLLRELLLIDIAYRRERGETPMSEEYGVRLPSHCVTIADAFHQVSTSDSDKRHHVGLAGGGDGDRSAAFAQGD